MDTEAQIERLTQLYLAAFLSFAVKRINDFNEAEELAQEIVCQCLLSIHKGKAIRNFDAFVWSVAPNTYKRWCVRKQTVSLEAEYDTYSNIMHDAMPIEDGLVKQ